MISFKDGNRYKVVYQYKGIKQLYAQTVIADSVQIAESIVRNNVNANPLYPLQKIVSIINTKGGA